MGRCRHPDVKAWVLVVLLTWGFQIYVYGRWQIISGFATWSECNGVRERMVEDYAFSPSVVIKECEWEEKK